MDILAIKNVATRAVGLGVLRARKHSPTILTAVGIVGSVTSTVLACKATLKLEPVIDELETDVELINDGHFSEEKLRTIQLGYAYSRASLKIARLYAPAAGVGALSVGCLIGAQGIMQRRNAALMTAYAALEKGFNEYRKRVEAAIGADGERELRYGLRTEDVHNTKDGVVEKVSIVDPSAVSVYARFFDEGTPNWTKTPEYNLLFLKCQQDYANDILRARGHIFLNEVYDMLGLERSGAGSVVGWIISKDGDNYVDFGLYNGDRENSRGFVNGFEHAILLDFNVDGVIYDKI